MEIEVKVERADVKAWLDKRNLKGFRILFSWPINPDSLWNLSKERIMIQTDKGHFFTLAEVEKEIGKPVFTVVTV